MKKIFLSCFLIFLNWGNISYAENLIDLYKSGVKNSPNFKAFEIKNTALDFNNKSIEKNRFINFNTELKRNIFNSFNELSSGENIIFNANFDLFYKKKPEIEKNILEIEKNLSLLTLEKKDLFIKITDLYFEYIKYKKLLEVHKKNLDWVIKNIFIVEKGIEGGIYPSNEIFRWKIEKYKQENILENDNLQLKLILEDLKKITFLDNIKITEELKSKNIFSVEAILKNDPQQKITNLSNSQVEKEIEIEKNYWYPEFRLSNEYNFSRNITIKEANFNNNLNMEISINLYFNILDGGKEDKIASLGKNIELNNIEFLKYNQELKNTVNLKLLEIESQNKQINNAKNIIEVSETNLSKLLIGYHKKFIDLNTLITSYKENLVLQEDYINLSVNLEKNKEILYHLSSGDIY